MKTLLILSAILFSILPAFCQKKKAEKETAEMKTFRSLPYLGASNKQFKKTDFDGEMIISISESFNYPIHLHPKAVISGGLWNEDKTGLEEINGAEIGSIRVPANGNAFSSTIDLSSELGAKTEVHFLDTNGKSVASFNVYFPQRLSGTSNPAFSKDHTVKWNADTNNTTGIAIRYSFVKNVDDILEIPNETYWVLLNNDTGEFKFTKEELSKAAPDHTGIVFDIIRGNYGLAHQIIILLMKFAWSSCNTCMAMPSCRTRFENIKGGF
jgi:hypothetical protein